MPHALPGGCGGPPQQVGCGWGASPGTGGAAPPRWVCMWPASWAGVLQCTLHSLHRMRSARGAWSPWSFTAWMRRYAAVVKPSGGGVDWDGGAGGSARRRPQRRGCSPRLGTPSSDGPVLLPPHTSLVTWGQLLCGGRWGAAPPSAWGLGEWCQLLSRGTQRTYFPWLGGTSWGGGRTLISSHLKS